jgi:uncharacterized protein DUF4154
MALLSGRATGLVIGALLAGAVAGWSSTPEYQVKAAFLYNFAKFVEWPAGAAGPTAPIVICVIGHDPFGAVLDQTVQSKTINGRPLAVKRPADPAGLRSCRILFVGSSEGDQLPGLLKMAERAGILTVGDMDGFPRMGGMIGFVLEDNKVRFEVNVDAVERARIRISSQLLQLARVVHDGRGGSD